MLVSSLSLAKAQEVIPDFYKDPGIYPNRDYVNQHVSEHVDPFTGSLQIHSTDIFLPGNGGFDLKVVRSFNSAIINSNNGDAPGTHSLAGLGWHIHFGRALKRASTMFCLNSDTGVISDNPVLELPDGSRQVFAFTSGIATLLTTQRWRAECPGGSPTVYSPDGVRYEMNQLVTEVGGPQPIYAWYTTRITDRNGNSATIAYANGSSPEITSVTASDGRSISFTYFDAGLTSRRIASVSAAGATWTYAYTAVPTATGRYWLTQVTRPGGTTWQYAYNGYFGLDDPRNFQLMRMTYPEGGTVTYSYASIFFDSVTNPMSRSNVVNTKTTSDNGTWAFQYGPGSTNLYDRTVVTLPNNSGVIQYRHVGPNYATSGSVWRIGLMVEKRIGRLGEISDWLQIESLTWTGQLISNEDNVRQGAFPTRRDNDVYAPVLTQRAITRSTGYTTDYSGHDAYGNPTTITEFGPNGGNRTTNLSYYINTNLWIVRQVDDEVTVNVGAINRTWDANGNLLSETRDGVTTTYTRFATGDINTITRPRSLLSTYSNYARGVPQNEGHPEGVNISRIVSTAGNVTSETNGEGRTTTYGYDGLNRVTSITPPIGNPTTISYAAASKTATRGSLAEVTSYDGFGRVTNVTIGGIATAYQHDPLGRRTYQSIVGYPTIGKSFVYDLLNRVTLITFADNATRGYTYGSATVVVRDERNFSTTYRNRAYGDPDRTFLMGITVPFVPGWSGPCPWGQPCNPNPTTSGADVTIARNGRDLATSIAQGGFTRTFGYNANLGYYLTSATHPEMGTTVYGRDDAGNMISKQVGASDVTTYAYDSRNRLTNVTYPGNNPPAVTKTYTRTDKLRTITSAVATRSYSYDFNDNLIRESIGIDGRGWGASYNYNNTDQLASIEYPIFNRLADFVPNVLGRPTKVISSLGDLLTTGFWPNGQLFDVAFWGGSRVTHGMNVREWGNSVTVQTGDGVTQVASFLAHDVAGNIGAINDSADASYNRTLTHDSINRLTAINGPWGNGSLAYDSANNITQYNMGGSSRTFVYSNNRLDRIDGNAGGKVYSYDVYGNARPDGATNYDNAGNLINDAAGSYAYDGTNTRVRQQSGSVTTYEFRSASGLLLAEWLVQPGYYDRLKEHFYIGGKQAAEQQTEFLGDAVRPTTLQFFQPDLAGSPVAGTWAGGGLLYKENYRPYGERLNHTSDWLNQIWFAGQKENGSNGLIHMGARTYDPFAGRFLGPDPKEADPNSVHGINRYAYANNSPYRYVDPDGNSPLDVAFLIYDVAKLGVALYSGAGVGAALADVAASVVGVASPIPGVGQALKAARIADKAADASRSAVSAETAAKSAAHPTFKPGPFAGESIPARGPTRDFNAAERAEGRRVFSESGCHTCGAKETGTKTGNPVLDHQPVSALNREGAPQRLFPQCLNCSRDQGLAAIRELRKAGD